MQEESRIIYCNKHGFGCCRKNTIGLKIKKHTMCHSEISIYRCYSNKSLKILHNKINQCFRHINIISNSDFCGMFLLASDCAFFMLKHSITNNKFIRSVRYVSIKGIMLNFEKDFCHAFFLS